MVEVFSIICSSVAPLACACTATQNLWPNRVKSCHVASARELTEGVGSAHLSMFACSLVQGKQEEGRGGEGWRGCLYRVISGSPHKPRLQQSALFRSGYQHLSWGTAEGGDQ